MKAIFTAFVFAAVALSSNAHAAADFNVDPIIACQQAGPFNSVEALACEAVYTEKQFAVTSAKVQQLSGCEQAGPFNSVERQACLAVEAAATLSKACEQAGAFNSVEREACLKVYKN